jgi:hypothetical protein
VTPDLYSTLRPRATLPTLGRPKHDPNPANSGKALRAAVSGGVAGYTMAVNPDEDTELYVSSLSKSSKSSLNPSNDALRKHGILPPKPEAPRSPSPPPSPTLSEELDDLTLDELKYRVEEGDEDEDIEREVAKMQRQRFEEMLKEDREARFGRVYPISREDYTREVTDASKEKETEDSPEEEGTGVVCFLYKSR